MAHLILDYDGTLHESIHIYAPAFRKAQDYLVAKGLAQPRQYSDEEISVWLGFTAKDMWNLFLPQLSENEKNTCSNIIGDHMIELIEQGKGKLYPNVKETLIGLQKQGHTLIFLSNCKKDYMEAQKMAFNLTDYFVDFYCSENFNFIPKHQIFDGIKDHYPGEFIVIGDRAQDIEIAKTHNLMSIGCSYGYGNEAELQYATHIISKPEELMSILL